MRGSIKRGQTPHNSRALTLPASVYAGKRENGKIINVEKVRHRAVFAPVARISTMYSAFWSPKCRAILAAAGRLVGRALRLGKSKIGASYRRQRGQVRLCESVPG
jgi:hypothetical protein